MIDISIGPYEDAILILRFIIEKFTDKNVAIDILHAIAVFAIILELTLIKPEKIVFIEQDTVSMIEIIACLSEIESVTAFKEK